MKDTLTRDQFFDRLGVVESSAVIDAHTAAHNELAAHDAAIRAIEPQQEETHEERWAAAGWPFKWDDDLREYHARTGEATDGAVLWGGPDFGWHVILPTVQAVDEWIKARKEGHQ